MSDSDAALETALAAAIRQRRVAQGWSLEALAEAASLHRTSLGLVERGRRGLSVSAAHRIAAAFGLPLSALIREAEDASGRSGPAHR